MSRLRSRPRLRQLPRRNAHPGFPGLKIYRIPAEAKRTRKDGTPRDPKKIGKIHFPVFTPDGTRVVGFMVSPPDVAGMIKQSDSLRRARCRSRI